MLIVFINNTFYWCRTYKNMEKTRNWVRIQRDSLYNSINSLIQSASVTRPWFADFLNPSKFSKPYQKEAGRRIRENTKFFLSNYLITELVILILGM